MKNLVSKSFAKLVFIGLAVVTVCGVSASGTSAPEITASGRGILSAGTAADGTMIQREFSFSAHVRKDGRVEGMGMLYNPAERGSKEQPYLLQIDISCMNVDGDVVFFGGSTYRTTDSKLADAIYFSVQDNGEPGAEKDSMSRVYFFDDDPNTTGDPGLCMGNKVGDFPMETIVSGDISVGD